MRVRPLVLSSHDLQIMFLCVEAVLVGLIDHNDGNPETGQRIRDLTEVYSALSDFVTP